MILLIRRSRAPGKGSEDLGSAEVRLAMHLPLHSSVNNLHGAVPQFPTWERRVMFLQCRAAVKINIHLRDYGGAEG